MSIPNEKRVLADAEAVQRSVSRLAHQVLENNKGTENLAVIGIRTRGEFLARRLARKIQELEKKEVPVGVLDITLYRDDLRGKLEQPQLKATEILFDVSGKNIVLVDDVLFTGRTVRAALNALTDLGRPAKVELLVLIDRGHRELPIKADYVGKTYPTSIDQMITVCLMEVDSEDSIYLVNPLQNIEEIRSTV